VPCHAGTEKKAAATMVQKAFFFVGRSDVALAYESTGCGSHLGFSRSCQIRTEVFLCACRCRACQNPGNFRQRRLQNFCIFQDLVAAEQGVTGVLLWL